MNYQLAANTIRGLAMDGVEKAKSGHPGMPMGMADVAAVLWLRYLKHDPADPTWHNDADYKEWLAWMKKYYPNGDVLNSSNASMYASNAAIAHVLKAAGNDLSRENILREMLKLKDFAAPMLLPGITMTMSPDNYNLFRKIQLMKFDGKRWVTMGKPVGE